MSDLNNNPSLISQLFGDSSESNTGINVTADTAMRFSAVYACVRVLSESLGSMPLKVYKETPTGREVAKDNPAYYRLHDEPNKYMTSATWRESTQANLSLRGNGYSLIHWKGVRDFELEFVPSDLVQPQLKDGVLSYRVDGKWVSSDDILHIPALATDGYIGISPISAHIGRESIGLGLAAEKLGARFYQNGAHLKGVLETDHVLKDEAYQRLLQSFKRTYSGIDNTGSTALLEQGVKFKPISITPNEAQFIETRKFQINDIARIFRVPPHMIGDLERSTNNNIEHQSIEFLTYTLLPWVKKWEQEINRKLFGKGSKFFAEFDMNALLRANLADKAAHTAQMIQNGVMSPNEARKLDNLNGYEGGDEYFIQGATVPIKMAGKHLENKANKDNTIDGQ